MYCNILVTKPFDQYFTYKFNINQKITRGSLVQVDFGKKKDQIGVVYDIVDSPPKIAEKLQLKEIKSVFENIFLSENYYSLLIGSPIILWRQKDWFLSYFLSTIKSLIIVFLKIANKLFKRTKLNLI